MATLKDEKIPVNHHADVDQAVTTLAEALRNDEKIAKEAVIQQVVISYPGNASATIHYRTSQD